MSKKEDIVNIAIEMYKDEISTWFIYNELSQAISDKKISEKLKLLADMEKNHANFWRKFLENRGINVNNIRINYIILKMKALLFRILGYGLTLKILELGEDKAIRTYAELLESTNVLPDEKKELHSILEDELVHEEEFEEEESRLKEFLNHVRDAILGMNDGLVEILSVSAGLAGAYGDPVYVALGGSIVGIGGALSMAVGTYISVKAQRDVRLGLLSRIRLAAKYASKLLIERIRKSLLRKGYSEETVERISRDAAHNPALLSKIVAEEEYGLSEENIENPKIASIYTGLFYILGAFVPLIPYFMDLPVLLGLVASFLLAASMLAVSGTIVAISSSLPVKKKVLELVMSGVGSAIITYGIGAIASMIFGIETT